jgi:hypothetical protein
LIAFYAIAYANLSNHFKISNVSSDISFKKAKLVVENIIYEEFTGCINEEENKTYEEINYDCFFHVNINNYSDKLVEIQILDQYSDEGYRFSRFIIEFSIVKLIPEPSYDEPIDKFIFNSEEEIKKLKNRGLDDASRLLEQYTDQSISTKLATALDEFLDRSDGINDQHYSEWSRYIYLSVVTMTTLGYGDLIPISTVARLLVSTQAIVGIFLFGIFFYMLAKNDD